MFPSCSGSTAGIVFAIAKGLAASNARVVINGRTQDKVEAAKRELLTQVPGAQVTGVAADLGTAKGVADFVRQVPATDVLVQDRVVTTHLPDQVVHRE